MKRAVTVALGLLLSLILIQCNNDSGTGIILQPPTVSTISPSRVSFAEKVTATISGTNLSGASSVYLGDGVTIEGFTVLNQAAIEVRFTVNTNTSSGKRPVQVVTPGGTANIPDLLQVLNNRAPFARFSVSPDIGAANTVYTFDATESLDPDGNLVKFEWDFGDGKKKLGTVVSHQYSAAGTYDVQLTAVDDDDARATATGSVLVRAGNAPIAKFAIKPKEGDINTTYTLDASASTDPDGSIDEYTWNLSNGDTATGPVVQFNFRRSGNIDITLVVTDNDGLQNVERKSLTVGDFDEEKARAEIRAVVFEFFRRYSNLHGYTAEEIVVNWTDSPGCTGRNHEINIINKQKGIIEQTQATVNGSIEITFNNSTRAHAIAPADFVWTNFDGSNHSSTATHDFEFIFIDGKWQICNFVLVKQAGATFYLQ